MKTKEQKVILQIYAAMTASLLVSFVPHVAAALPALLFFTGTLVAAYVLRARHGDDSLMANHMSFIIRTIWISTFLAAVTVAGASFYVLMHYDPSPILACADKLMGMVSIPAMETTIRPCVDDFVGVNRRIFIDGTLIAAAPVALYFAFRLARGLSRAGKGHRIANIKNWM